MNNRIPSRTPSEALNFEVYASPDVSLRVGLRVRPQKSPVKTGLPTRLRLQPPGIRVISTFTLTPTHTLTRNLNHGPIREHLSTLTNAYEHLRTRNFERPSGRKSKI